MAKSLTSKQKEKRPGHINVYIFSSPVRLHHNLRGSLPSGAALCSPQQLGGDQVEDRDGDDNHDHSHV